MPWVTANLSLLKALLPLTAGVHFAWLGVIAGGATAAVALDILAPPSRRPLATALLARTAPGPGWPLPVLSGALVLIIAKSCYPGLAPSGLFWGGALAPLAAGLPLLALYRHMLRRGQWPQFRPVCGLAGIGLVLASCVLLCCGAGLLVMPEKWPFLSAMPLLVISWSGTARYLEFTCLALAGAGGVIMLIGERSAGGEEAQFARRLGGGMALLFLLAWPAALLFGMFNLPAVALSGVLWLTAAAALALAAIIATMLPGTLANPQRRVARPVLALLAALFAVWVASDHLARESTLDEATLVGIVAERPSPPAVAPPSGAAVFERICAPCHRFDKKLIGPPLDAVVPRYRQDPEALAAFIRNPVKRDPAYPAMPFLPLTEAEIEAVAAYLLERATP